MKTIISVLLLAGALTYLTGCGTLSGAISGGKRVVFLIDAPRDLKVSTNGTQWDITTEAFAYTPTSSSSGITYFTSGVKIPYKHRVQLELTSGTRTAKVELKPKTRLIYHIATIFIFPIGGNIIDAATKNDKELYPRFIDVQAALSGMNQSAWKSQGKLKRQTKRKANMVSY